jgi:hypothetical protein
MRSYRSGNTDRPAIADPSPQTGPSTGVRRSEGRRAVGCHQVAGCTNSAAGRQTQWVRRMASAYGRILPRHAVTVGGSVTGVRSGPVQQREDLCCAVEGGLPNDISGDPEVLCLPPELINHLGDGSDEQVRRRTCFLNGHFRKVGSQLGQCLVPIVGDGHNLDERFDFRFLGPTRAGVLDDGELVV